MKTLFALLAASGLLIASQHPAQAQVSFGIPLPFPFAFYNSTKVISSLITVSVPTTASPTTVGLPITARATTAARATARLLGMCTFTADIIGHGITTSRATTDLGGNRATMVPAGVRATQVGDKSESRLTVERGSESGIQSPLAWPWLGRLGFSVFR
jgi:hypothetical protein